MQRIVRLAPVWLPVNNELTVNKKSWRCLADSHATYYLLYSITYGSDPPPSISALKVPLETELILFSDRAMSTWFKLNFNCRFDEIHRNLGGVKTDADDRIQGLVKLITSLIVDLQQGLDHYNQMFERYRCFYVHLFSFHSTT